MDENKTKSMHRSPRNRIVQYNTSQDGTIFQGVLPPLELDANESDDGYNMDLAHMEKTLTVA